MKKRILTFMLLAVVIMLPADMSAQQTNHTTINPEKTWEYEGYDVTKFDTGERYEYFEHLRNTEEFRAMGVLPFAGRIPDRDRFELLILREDDNSVIATGYYLVTSISYRSTPHPYSSQYYDDKIVVKRDSAWYLYDPTTLEATEILSKKDIPDRTYDGPINQQFEGLDTRHRKYGFNNYNVVVIGNKLYATSKPTVYPGPLYDRTPKYLLVNVDNTKPIQLEPFYGSSGPANPNKESNEKRDEHVQAPPYFYPTDKSAAGLVGQIGAGVYVKQSGKLTKIGYTKRAPSYKSDSYTRTNQSPITFAGDKVVWMGVDGAMYVATINSSALKHTGVQDVPTNTPFRTETNPTVYFKPPESRHYFRGTTLYNEPKAFVRYENKDAYMRDHDDPNFEKVLWIPENASGAEKFAE
jgi:hypothetical protein